MRGVRVATFATLTTGTSLPRHPVSVFRSLAILALLTASCGAPTSIPASASPSRTTAAGPAPSATVELRTPSAEPTRRPLVVSPLPAPSRLTLSDRALAPGTGSYLLFQVRGEEHLRGVAWDGSANGVLAGKVGAKAVWSQAPDGSRYTVGSTVYDRAGRMLGALPASWRDPSEVAWAAHGDLLCGAVPETWRTGSPLRLETALPGGPARLVASGYGIYGDNAGYPVLACDPTTDRAVVAALGQGVFAGRLWVFRLSTGELLRSVDLGTGAVGSWVAASKDGALLAETITDASGRSTATIRRADDGAALATLAGFDAHGFSGDGSLLVGWLDHRKLEIVEWGTGRVVWSLTGSPYPYAGWSAEPFGAHFAVSVSPSGDQVDWEVYLVTPAGRSVRLPAGIRVLDHF